jgi:hypothetical protein
MMAVPARIAVGSVVVEGVVDIVVVPLCPRWAVEGLSFGNTNPVRVSNAVGSGAVD